MSGGRVSGGECEDIWEGLEGEMHDLVENLVQNLCIEWGHNH